MSKRPSGPPQIDLCIIASPGAGTVYMHAFDRLSPETRNRLRNSPWNLCTLCFQNLTQEWGLSDETAFQILTILARGDSREIAQLKRTIPENLSRFLFLKAWFKECQQSTEC